jgi:transcription antitermination factor NusG
MILINSTTELVAPKIAPCWYALYTRANHERRVALELADRGVDHFLPCYESVRRWKDRRKLLRLPLFPGYVFVRIHLNDRLRALQVAGAVRLVGFNGTPAALPDDEILALREILGSGSKAAPFPYKSIGRRFRILRGAFAGLEGKLVRRRNRWRVVLSIDLIQRSVLVDMDASDLEIPAARNA